MIGWQEYCFFNANPSTVLVAVAIASTYKYLAGNLRVVLFLYAFSVPAKTPFFQNELFLCYPFKPQYPHTNSPN